MSEPTSQQQGAPARQTFRPGQVVSFRHPDPTNPDQDLTGKGVVVKVGEDGASVAILPVSLFHLEVHPDNVAPVKASELLPAALQEPESSSS